ncbi:hypothetical protein SAMN04488056_103205 [Cohaesibacter marisflavi]|uniref:Uncharacterized protein n=1 Tax=Cohaesibacter marisflavi TaxID=655353 RepID=A0A1I5EJ21_9HYPH|nr:DUF6101 family protein [Cohaesibacter marisflavi]SFO11468.1 hypothetical protein SAMN04488056_103205 [Cohaesibacter marisflavi]
MRRQENQKYTEAISYQVEGAARIDPHNLAKYFQSGEIRSKAAKLSGFSETALFGAQVPGIVQIKADQVLVECNLSCGLPLLVRVPLAYYKGVGARFIVGKREGNPLICILELVHDDPNLTLPLMASTDLEEAAVDWQSWSNRYHLPMLHKPLGAGDYEVASDRNGPLADLVTGPQMPRRPHAQISARRPRFLVRRKTGTCGPMQHFQEREIIARN